MTAEEAKEIIGQGEGINIEFKTCKDKISHSVYESVCAFLNHSGGYILLGIGDKGEILGINEKNLEQMIRNFIHVINDPKLFSPKAYVSPQIIEIDNKKIICIYVEKSIYVHRYKGMFFDRNGDADVDVTEQHGLLANLYSRKAPESSENRIVPFLELDDLDPETFDYCRKLVSLRNKSHPWIKLSNEELLKSCGFIAKDLTTGIVGIKQAALLLFGKESSIATFMSSYRIEAIYRNKTEDYYNQNNLEDSIRYDDRITIRTNLITAYDSLMAFVMKYLPEKFYIDDGTTQRGDLRSNIFREIVANLLVHREYSNPFAGTFEIFSDRVITKNYTRSIPSFRTGVISIDDLESCTKNPLLVKVFRELGWVEELGSGSRNIKKFAPLYFDNSVIEITNQELFIFSITYSGLGNRVNNSRNRVNNSRGRVNNSSDSVNNGSDSVNDSSDSVNIIGDSVESKVDNISLSAALSDSTLEDKLLVLLEKLALSKVIRKRMIQELKIIYREEKIDKVSLSALLNYSNSQLKGDLRVLIQEKIIEYSAKEKKYLLLREILSQIEKS